MRVLVVDDEPLSAMVLQMFLQDKGMEVEVANDGEQALKIATDFRPDLVVTDHLLGNFRGTDLVRTLSETHDSLVSMIITGLPKEELGTEISSLPIREIFTKPVDLERLYAAIRDATT